MPEISLKLVSYKGLIEELKCLNKKEKNTNLLRE